MSRVPGEGGERDSPERGEGERGNGLQGGRRVKEESRSSYACS